MKSAAQDSIDTALDDVEDAGLDHGLLRAFTSQLFLHVEQGELEGYRAENLAKLAVSAFHFFNERGAKPVKLRGYNSDDDSVEGPATVIEVLTDDMPFLVSSVLAELINSGCTVRFVAHPIYRVKRDENGKLLELGNAGDSTVSQMKAESFQHVVIDRIEEDSDREALLERLERVLYDVRLVVDDWKPMLQRLSEVIASYEASPPPVAVDELAESIEFLRWLADGHFTFLGAREYQFTENDGGPRLDRLPEKNLGLARDPNLYVLRRTGASTELSAEARELFKSAAPLIVAKANFLSPVQRRVHVDSIGIKLYSAEGKVTGELRFLGLFSASVYNESPRRIPFLRHKVQQVFRRSRNESNSYSGRVLTNILETYPRDELFQISTERLYEITDALVRLELMPRTRVFVRRDEYGRFASILVYVLRERFTTEVRQEIIAHLEKTFEGQLSEFTPVFTIGPLVRLHVVIWKDDAPFPEVSADELEHEIAAMVRSWNDRLLNLLHTHYTNGLKDVVRSYGDAFSPGYRYDNPPERAIIDIERLRKLSDEVPVAINFFREEGAPEYALRVTLYQLHEPISLSKRVPILENLCFSVISERTYELRPMSAQGPYTVFLHDLRLETANRETIDLETHDARLEECFLSVWRGEAGNDRFNGLIVGAGLNCREAALLRAYSSYLRQIGAPFGQVYLAATLNKHCNIVQELVRLFHTLFEPSRGGTADQRRQQAADIARLIETKLDSVESLDEDRMLRRFVSLIQATIRTNYYQEPTDLTAGGSIALKIDSDKVDGMPEPKPFAEIFVTSPRFEGVHLRGGPIARGGLRWSDRPQDFRTEVLGLAKAQQVKNAIIVPQGAKGGFVPRRIAAGATRDQMMAEGIACYRSFIANLLSVTDNLENGDVVPPQRTVRLDDDDPYLVVAADKGTATFSDIANALSVERGFWLKDAFASGGSAGYDHKKMGITARGAWEAVKRHFRELNIDIQTTPFDVIGIGDMSGDVFGNGMLLSKEIHLIAAFDHRDIFIDPVPDPETGWHERKRLFDMSRSSWQDYNKELISQGGGVFSRSAKSITLTPEMQQRFGTAVSSTSPNELIRIILRTSADLLWFGGIGTYIRASEETDEQVNDRSNDGVRISALECGAKVIGEGANLGITQRGRIEFAQQGGKINTDAIDNSAGVNSSDMEVNIKIALRDPVEKGRLTIEDRNEILVAMTDEVARTVLQNNYLQSLAISLGEMRGLTDLGFQNRLMYRLENAGMLDRALELLPSDVEITERRERRQPLTRPELAVLLAYSKISLYFELIKSPVVDDPYLSRVLADYFPKTMRERFAEDIEKHALRREIIATMLSNAIINRGGSTFIVRLAEETGRNEGDIAHGFAATMGVFRVADFYRAVDELDNRIDGVVQLHLYMRIQDLIRYQTAWFLRHGKLSEGLSGIIERYRAGVDKLFAAVDTLFDEWLHGRLDDMQTDLVLQDVPEDLAWRFTYLGALSAAPEIITLAIKLDRPEVELGRVYFSAASHFRLEEVRVASETLAQTDYYTRLAVNSTVEAIASAQRAIVEKIYASAPEGGEPDFIAWCRVHDKEVTRARKSFDDILDGSELTLAKLTIAVAHLRELAER